MEIGLIVLIAAVVGGGVCGALIRSWSLSLNVYSLARRLNALEQGLVSEQRQRASRTRWDKKELEKEVAELSPLPHTPAKIAGGAQPWWWNNPTSQP